MKLTSSHIISRSGFTLIELLISMVIFWILSMMILTVYFNATNASRKLSMTRELSEAAREITERLAEDIKERWINAWYFEFDPSYDLWKNTGYSWEGSEVLWVWSDHIYAYWRKSDVWLDPCDELSAKNPKIHCWLYLVTDWENYNLVDSFIPDETKKRVKIESLRFYVTGDDKTAKKVTLNFTLALLPRIWVPTSLISTTKLHIQTTFSERSWKN